MFVFQGSRMQRLMFLLIVLATILHTQAQTHTHGKRTGSSPSEDSLRIRLQLNPHDAQADQQLVDLLSKKYSFRAIATEDADWLKNNPTDSVALTELISFAETALHDPEYAISQVQLSLSRQ
jgi:hypothetical protein